MYGFCVRKYRKLREVLGSLQMALDIRGGETSDLQRLNNIAILQIIVPDPTLKENAKKILEGIGLPEASYTPLRVILDTDPIPPDYVFASDIVSFFSPPTALSFKIHTHKKTLRTI